MTLVAPEGCGMGLLDDGRSWRLCSRKTTSALLLLFVRRRSLVLYVIFFCVLVLFFQVTRQNTLAVYGDSARLYEVLSLGTEGPPEDAGVTEGPWGYLDRHDSLGSSVEVIRKLCPNGVHHEKPTSTNRVFLRDSRIAVENTDQRTYIILRIAVVDSDIKGRTDTFCQLWSESESFLALVTRAKVVVTDRPANDTLMPGRQTVRFVQTISCEFPSIAHHVAEAFVALVAEPCVKPDHTVRLQPFVKDPALITSHDTTDATDVNEEAPSWRESLTHLLSNHSYLSPMVACPGGNHEDDEQDKWQTIEKKISYVYSAYADVREKSGLWLKAFGLVSRAAALTNKLRGYYCQLVLGPGERPLLTGLEVWDILAGRRIEFTTPRYRDVVYLCRFHDVVPANLSAHATLSIIPGTCSDGPTNILHVHTMAASTAPKSKFTFCLSGALIYKFEQVKQFVEWIELNSIFGAERFFIYDFSHGPALTPYMDYYQRIGKAKIMPWKFPSGLQNVDKANIMWYFGQRIIINDCLYRNMYRSEFVVFGDLDEIVSPKEPLTSWTEVLREAGCWNTPYAIARNVFFPTDWPDDSEISNMSLVRALNLTTLLKTSRERKVYPQNKRGKYFVRPEGVEKLLVHRPVPRQPVTEDPCIIPPHVGLMHHFRQDSRFRTETISDSLTDRSLHVFGQDLITRVTKVHRAIGRL